MSIGFYAIGNKSIFHCLMPALSRFFRMPAWPMRSLVLGLLISSCQTSNGPAGWEGQYCLRWAEEEENGERVAEFLNTCDGLHEQIELFRDGHTLHMKGAEGRRGLDEAGLYKAHAQGHLEDCGDSIVVQYSLHRQGQQIILEKSWSHEGVAYLSRRSYEQ